MWENIGRRLQGLAKVICWLGIIGSVITAIVLWSQNSRYQPTVLLGIIYLVIGCLVSWIGSWSMYGLGLVVEQVENGRTVSFGHSRSEVPQPLTPPIDEEQARKNKILSEGGWKCPQCGTINQSYITSCGCGMRKMDAKKK